MNTYNLKRNSFVPYTGVPYIDDNGVSVNTNSWSQTRPANHVDRSIIYPSQPQYHQNICSSSASLMDNNHTKRLNDYDLANYYFNCNYSANNLFR
jgi:hypothetical protein